MSELKTAEETLKESIGKVFSGFLDPESDIQAYYDEYYKYNKIMPLAMKAYALQVAKATRTECIKVYNESGGNDFEVANINLTQFIK